MVCYVVKVLLTAVIIVAISELGKRSTFAGSLLASLPLTSLLALLWLYAEGADKAKLGALTTGIFWLVLPSLVFFVLLPVLLKAGLPFLAGFGIACAATVLAYFGMVAVLGRLSITI